MARTKATAKVNPGVCGNTCSVTALCDEDQQVEFEMDSPCEKIRAFAADLGEVDAYEEIGAGFDGVIWTSARKHLRGACCGCVVPAAVYRAMQVAAGLNLPRPLVIELEKSEIP
jgi:hypothetical protein